MRNINAARRFVLFKLFAKFCKFCEYTSDVKQFYEGWYEIPLLGTVAFEKSDGTLQFMW